MLNAPKIHFLINLLFFSLNNNSVHFEAYKCAIIKIYDRTVEFQFKLHIHADLCRYFFVYIVKYTLQSAFGLTYIGDHFKSNINTEVCKLL